MVAIGLLAVSAPLALRADAGIAGLAAALALAGGLALRFPLVAAMIVGALLMLAAGYGPLPVGNAVLAAPVSVAACAAHGRARASVVLGLAQVTAPVLAALPGNAVTPGLIESTALLVGLQPLAMLGGLAIHRQTQHLRAERRRRMQELDQQRRGFARELHDSGIRAAGQVVMLAESSARRSGIAPADAAAFVRISHTARRATEEMRTLLSSLRGPRAGEPGAGQPRPDGIITLDPASERCRSVTVSQMLEEIREQLASAGFIVRLSIEGDIDAPGRCITVLRRCLDEIEANVLRHGDRDVPVEIMVTCTDSGIDLVVLNGTAERDDTGLSGGWGLTGMSERLEAVGGRVETRHEGSTFLTHVLAPRLSEAA